MEQGQFKEVLRKHGLKVTSQRLLVLETMACHPGEHLTAEEIHDMARGKYPEIGLATIYRTLQVLVGLQVIDRVCFDDGAVRYELGTDKGPGSHHHHHAICQRCGQVISFEGDLLETLEQALYDTMGCTVTDHEVKLVGYCKNCANREKQGKRERPG